MTQSHERYMQRCLQLAGYGMGTVAPNPLVGAVLVYNDEIISEGWHQQFGGPHAERMAIDNIKNDPRLFESTLYVNLEPCAHYGKQPPCANLIVESGIKTVVFGSHDPFEKVNGNGLKILHENGIKTVGPILEQECNNLNRRFFVFHTKKRPYIILKWAETADGFLAPEDKVRTQISGEAAQQLLHKWRCEEPAILVGAETATIDKPMLNVRNWHGNNPIPVFFDPHIRADYSKYSQGVVFNLLKNEVANQVEFVKCEQPNLISEAMDVLYKKNIQSILVEGGKKTLEAYIDAGCWDEVRVIKSKSINFSKGDSSPVFKGNCIEKFDLVNDTIGIYYKI